MATKGLNFGKPLIYHCKTLNNDLLQSDNSFQIKPKEIFSSDINKSVLPNDKFPGKYLSLPGLSAKETMDTVDSNKQDTKMNQSECIQVKKPTIVVSRDTR